MSEYLFTSKRLGFRVCKKDDLVAFAAINADPKVMEFFPSTKTLDETQKAIARFQSEHMKNGYSAYAVELLDTKEFIGYIGLMIPSFKSNFTPCTEIGWRLNKDYWNKGLATEGALRCIEYGFDNLNLPEIFAFTARINKKSEHIMNKIGMQKSGEFEHPSLADGHILKTHVLYKISNPNI